MKADYKNAIEEIQAIIDVMEFNNIAEVRKDKGCVDVLNNVLACLKCSEIGTYDCYVEVPETDGKIICCDKCLATEVKILNEIGIKTIGCCCGHGKLQGYIQVAPEYCDRMKEMGYIERPVDEYGNGYWCFKPKSILLNQLYGEMRDETD